ncbi:thioredoxin family protein [Gracilibacillus sp. Marseille-QA3620]
MKKAIYAYTPLCGTCQVAGKMLDVAKELVCNVEIERVNLNYAKELAEQYQIESVPCLILLEGELVVDKIYAFQSVPYLIARLRDL